MKKEQMILESLKKELTPYEFETQKRIGIEFHETAYRVGKVAKEHSLILDRCIEERKNRMPKPIQHDPKLLDELRKITGTKDADLAITDLQHEKELSNLRLAVTTMLLVRPMTEDEHERLARVCEISNSRFANPNKFLHLQ